MPVTTALAIFFLIWWVVLFAVLPWGIRSQHERRRDRRPAPIPARRRPEAGTQAVWTTLVSVVIFAACYVVYVNHLVTLEGLVRPFGMR